MVHTDNKFINWYGFELTFLFSPFIAGLANLPMHAPELAVQEMKRAVVDLKMSGFQIGSHVGDWNLDAKVGSLYGVLSTLL